MSETEKEAGIADSARGSEGTVGAQQWYVEDTIEDDDTIRLMTGTRVTNPGAFQCHHEIEYDAFGLTEEQLVEIRATFRLFAASSNLLSAAVGIVAAYEGAFDADGRVLRNPDVTAALIGEALTSTRAAISKATGR